MTILDKCPNRADTLSMNIRKLSSITLSLLMCACASPQQAGVQDAKKDYKAGKMQLEVYGLRKRTSPYETYLAKHDIKLKPVAGCVINNQIREHANGYNSTMKQLVNQRMGRDIFKEAEKATQQQ